MSILPLVISPDPLLKKISKEVETIDDELKSFMKDMVNTMYHEHGVGLAAVQVGRLDRVLVIDVDYEIDEDATDNGDCCATNSCGVKVRNTNPRYFINPEIVEFSDEQTSFNEGCLSFPGARAMVDRSESVCVKYLDFNGKEKKEVMDGLLAICIQHEMDHLNGITFVDHISKLKRDLILKKMRKLGKR